MTYTYDAAKFKHEFERSFTWIEGFMRNVRRYSGRCALIDPPKDKSWTYYELNRDVNRLAHALQKSGVGAGDVVQYQLYNSSAFVLSYIAPQKLGAVNSPANFNLSAGETARMLERDRPKVYIYDCDVREMAWKALELSSYKPVTAVAVNYRGTDITLPDGHVFFDDYMAGESDEEPKTDHVPDMYAEVTRLGTSGTTGTPKGVPLNNVNEVLSAHDVIMHFPLSYRDITMNMTPWFHRGGLYSGGIVPTMYVGGCVVILRMFNAKTCVDYVCHYGITFLIGVPSALNNLAVRQEKHPADLSGLKGIVTMGSPLSYDECIRYRELLTPNIFNGYGTTETFWNSFLRPFDLPDKAGSAGGSCTDDEVRVVYIRGDVRTEPEDTVPTDGKTEGEIIIRALGKTSLSYVDNPELTEERYYKGWYYTRDMGSWDENRYVTVRGRRDDMIICMGENIYPTQVEEVICRCPGVKDCMVTGVPDTSRGEAVAAYILPSDPALTIRDVNMFCINSNDISGYKCPRYYILTDSLPYNATGKKMHALLKKQAVKDLEDGLLLHP